MDSEWVVNEERFDVLTRLVRNTITLRQNLEPDEQDLCDSAVEDGIANVDRLVICPSCGARGSYSNLPRSCDSIDCQHTLTENDPTEVQYTTDIYPDEFRGLLEERLEKLCIHFSDVSGMDEVLVTDLHPSIPEEEGEPHLHISYNLEIGQEYALFPGYDDVFLDWNYLPELVEHPEGVTDDIEKFRETSRFTPGELPTGEVEDIHYAGPGAPGPEYASKQSWYTLLDRVDEKKEAHKLSKKRFGINYNEMFERLGIECLHTLFPHAVTLHLGGDHKPDGLLHLSKKEDVKTYLVEAKCYSDDFKIFDEEDKANRYIRRFSNQLESSETNDFNLCGYIFLAHSFKDGRLPSDIHRFVNRNVSYANLEVACLNSHLMKTSVDQMWRLYREEPSATYRIRKRTDEYWSLAEGLATYTENYSSSPEDFKNRVLDIFDRMGRQKSRLEEALDDGFSPKPSWEELQEEYA